jgi:AcrR family transcriptional regulator
MNSTSVPVEPVAPVERAGAMKSAEPVGTAPGRPGSDGGETGSGQSGASLKRQALTRDVVLNAARRILVTEGLDAVSLRRVAAALQVTAPALYAYVRDKLVQQFARADGRDPTERLRAMALTYVEFARRHPSVFRATFLVHPELAMEKAGGEPPITRVFRVGSGPFEDLAQRGQLGEPDPRHAALTFWTGVHGAATVTVSASNLDPAERARISASVIDTLLRGVGRSRSHETGAA